MMVRQAELLLERGVSVVLDATWASAEARARLRAVAEKTASALTEIRCDVDTAIAKDIIEHMLWVVPFMDECWRIVKPGGKLLIRTTYFQYEQGYKDPTHFHFFTLDSFDFFDPETDQAI